MCRVFFSKASAPPPSQLRKSWAYSQKHCYSLVLKVRSTLGDVKYPKSQDYKKKTLHGYAPRPTTQDLSITGEFIQELPGICGVFLRPGFKKESPKSADGTKKIRRRNQEFKLFFYNFRKVNLPSLASEGLELMEGCDFVITNEVFTKIATILMLGATAICVSS